MVYLYDTNKTTTFKTSRKSDYSLDIYCEYKKTSYGFKHEATMKLWLYDKNGERTNFIETFDKATYYNRTWERFTFESVILGAFSKALKQVKDKSEQKKIKRIQGNLLKAVNNYKYKKVYCGY